MHHSWMQIYLIILSLRVINDLSERGVNAFNPLLTCVEEHKRFILQVDVEQWNKLKKLIKILTVLTFRMHFRISDLVFKVVDLAENLSRVGLFSLQGIGELRYRHFFIFSYSA